MQSLFPIIVFGAVAFSIVMSVVFLVSRGGMYDHIGQGGMTGDREQIGEEPPAAPDSAAGRAEQELEIRQMLGARSDRLVSRGQPALDIDAEVARLMAPPAEHEGHAPALVDEVRQLVVARNERRRRQGLEPLEVEAEVARTLQEFSP
ncbi:MAG TPA: hypothetical protein VG010_06830 [Solirubrobacteraceae bacterium]|nr:hypothetical protein [Solirubrobacteraceae bacterium]